MNTVQDKVCIVAGSTRGIGYAIVKELAREGGKCVVTGRVAENCDKVRDEIIAEGGEAIAVPCDITNLEEFDTVVEKTLEAYGRIDVLVCNAARSKKGLFLDITPEDFEESFNYVVAASYFAAQKAAKQMISQGDGGRIILISSTAGLYAERENGIYCALKAAVMNMAKTMALELGEYNINVNVVAPGTTRRINDSRSEEVMEGFRLMSCLPELNTQDDIAPAVAFLASDGAKGITGQTLAVDAGFSIAMQPEKIFNH